ncbi:MAG: hypothetical protein U0840_30225 [Gemmataceae bacterium]
MRILPVLLLIGSTTTPAWGDAGQLRLTREQACLRVSVFTAPNPPRTGLLDVSVLVQDPSGKVQLQKPILVRAEQGVHQLEAIASHELATNKLLQAAHFQLPEPGLWTLRVTVGSVPGFDCSLEVAHGLPSWWPLVPWIGWPFVVVAGFFLLRWVRRDEILEKKVEITTMKER